MGWQTYFMGPRWEINSSSFKAVEHIIHKTKNLQIMHQKYPSQFCQK